MGFALPGLNFQCHFLSKHKQVYYEKYIESGHTCLRILNGIGIGCGTKNLCKRAPVPPGNNCKAPHGTSRQCMDR
jgi:hypothetical protein